MFLSVFEFRRYAVLDELVIRLSVSYVNPKKEIILFFFLLVWFDLATVTSDSDQQKENIERAPGCARTRARICVLF